MKLLRPLSLLALCMLLLLTQACKNQPANKEAAGKQETEPVPAQTPLRPADPASEEQLRQAAFGGSKSEVSRLLEQGVAVDAMDVEGRTALFFAAFNGHSEIIMELLEAGASVNGRDAMGRTALMYASTGSFPEAVSILLDQGADPNLVDSDEHFTALMHAAAEGNLEVVRVLIDHGADPGLKDIDGDDAASFAAQSGHEHVVKYLLQLD